MTITTSPDITNLEVQVTWDISNTTPQISLVNLSTGSGLANCTWWFIALSPSQTIIHEGSEGSPDKTGVWATASLTDAWPRPYNQIEWSGAPYSFQVYVKDGNGNIYSNAPQTVSICRPAGNTSVSKNTYGLASANVSVRCQEARVFFEDTTYHSYKGGDGTEIGSVLKVTYPIDETGNIPAPFSATSFSTALVPITYSSDNYQFWQYSIYDYDMGNDTLIRIRYQVVQTFAVWCNVDLEPLVCEFNKLINSIENGSCLDVEDANKKLALISPKMFMVFMGTLQPLTGVDVPALIDEIKTIGGFDCNCCAAPTGIIPQTSSIIDGYNFAINPVCGDISGSVSVNGYNITFNLQDISYVFSIANESPSETTAFSIEPTVSGCQKTYALKIDGNQLATDILNIIKNDSTLVNLFNSIVNNGSSGTLLVDGKCIFQTASSCDYTFDFLNIPADTTYAILTGINGSPVNFAFNETNLTAFQSYLNALGYGTFVVTNPNSGEVLLTSNTNTHSITQMTYNVASTNYIAAMTKDCTGYTPVTPSQAVQAIIDYLCGFTDAEVVTSEDYTICYIDPTTKLKTEVVVTAGESLAVFITELLARGCDTVTYVSGISADTCSAIQNLFPQSKNVLQPNDIILGTKQGDCARITPVELGTKLLQYGLTDATFLAAFCDLVTACNGGAPCAPFSLFYLTVPYSSPTDDTMDIIVNFAHPSAVSYTIRYARIDNTNTPNYITIPSVLSSPYAISGIDDGQYIVGITPVYADGRKCNETTQTTSGCTGISAFSAILGGSPTSEFIVSYTAAASVPKVRVNINYPNGGSWSQIYTNDGVDINIPFPTNVFGSFAITIQPVCNENTGYFGTATAPIILTVNDPNATNNNYTVSASYNLSIDSVSGTGVPALGSTGTNGSQYGTQTGMSGTYVIVISGSVVTTTKLDVYVNSVVVSCQAVAAAGTFYATVSAASTDDVIIAIDSGTC